jgi:hypothetical protein
MNNHIVYLHALLVIIMAERFFVSSFALTASDHTTRRVRL